VKWENGQGNIGDVRALILTVLHDLTLAPKQLRKAGAECAARSKGGPNLIVVVLPDGGNDIYTAVKQYVPFYKIV
jgi:eukaryotic translation initiation factor 2C